MTRTELGRNCRITTGIIGAVAFAGERSALPAVEKREYALRYREENTIGNRQNRKEMPMDDDRSSTFFTVSN
jgi:hypothetical protein